VVIEHLRLRLVQFVPGMRANTIYVDPFVRVRLKETAKEVFGVGGEELGQGVVGVKNFLV